MNQVAKSQGQTVPAIHEEAPSLLAVISRAAGDPNCDVDKMERLLEMARQVRKDDARMAYISALADVQNELPEIEEHGAIDLGRGGKAQRYALWEDINATIKPVLQKHGFALSFRTGRADGQIVVKGVLAHKEGHSEETEIFLPSDTSGSKNAVQAVGSSTSYGKRYTAMALLNLTSRGEDDDGKRGGGQHPISAEQVSEIIERLNACDADIEAFCRYMKIAAVKDLTAVQLKPALAAVAKKEAKK